MLQEPVYVIDEELFVREDVTAEVKDIGDDSRDVLGVIDIISNNLVANPSFTNL